MESLGTTESNLQWRLSNLGTGAHPELTAYQLQAYAYILYSYTPPQVRRSPNIFMKCFAFAFGSAFISMSAVMSSVGQYIRLIDPLCTSKQIKWYLISICLVHAWYEPSFMSVIAD